MRHHIMLRSPDGYAPSIPTGVRLTDNQLTWNASADPYTEPAGGTGMKEYVIDRDGSFLATVPTTPGFSLPLISIDVGGAVPAGSDSQAGVSHTMRSAGERIFATSDQFRFKYGTVSGNCSITARISQFLPNAAGYAKASLMFRESTGTTSACVHLMQYSNVANSGTKIEYRTSTAVFMSDGVTVSAATLPQWLRLVRTGNSFSGFYSYDGNTWLSNGTVTVDLPTSALVGIALCSEVPGVLVDATFDNLAVTNQPDQVYLDTQQTGAHVYRVAARDNAGNLSAYSAPTTTSDTASLTLSSGGTNAVTMAITANPDAGQTVVEYEARRSLDGSAWTTVALTEPAYPTEVPPFEYTTATRTVGTSSGIQTGIPGGTPNYATITAALAAASDGANECIVVYPGTYVESVLVTKNSIKLRASDPNNRPIIDGQTTYPLGWDNTGGVTGSNALVALAGNSVTFDGFILRNSKYFGMTLGPANNNGYFVANNDDYRSSIKVYRCDITRSREPALVHMNADLCDIRGNYMFENIWKYANGNSPAITDPSGWPACVSLMGRRVRFIENVVLCSYGEGISIGYHGDISADPSGQNGDCAIEGVICRRNVFGNHWSAAMYITDVRAWRGTGEWSLIEQNFIFQADLNFGKGMSSPIGQRQYATALGIASEGNNQGTYPGQPSRDGLVGGRHFKLRNNIIVGGTHGIEFPVFTDQDVNDFHVENNTVFSQRNVYNQDGCIANDNNDDGLRNVTWRNNLFHNINGTPIGRSWYGSPYNAGYRVFFDWLGTTVNATNLWNAEPIREQPPDGASGSAPGNIKSGTDIVRNTSLGLSDVGYLPQVAWGVTPIYDTAKGKISAGSPAVNAGTLVSDMSVDFYGNPRPTYTSRFDIGAHSLSKPTSVIYTESSITPGVWQYQVRYRQSDNYVSPWSATRTITV